MARTDGPWNASPPPSLATDFEQLWAKLLAITPRSEETRMRLENIRVAKENAERGSVPSKQQILSGFLKTKIGWLAFEDFQDGKPG